jgi:Amt family ammonium transporter
VLLKVVALVFPLRASQDDEQVGMDLIAHGEEAYVHASGSGV